MWLTFALLHPAVSKATEFQASAWDLASAMQPRGSAQTVNTMESIVYIFLT